MIDEKRMKDIRTISSPIRRLIFFKEIVIKINILKHIIWKFDQ
jgi:hypothetical protein